MSTTTARSPHLDSLRDEEVGWTDVKPNTRQSKIWPSTATEMPSDAYGKLRSERNVSIYAAAMTASTHLIAPAAALGPKLLSNVVPKFLSNQSHPVHVAWTQRQRQMEEQRQDLDVGGVVWDIDRLRGRRHSSKRSGDKHR